MIPFIRSITELMILTQPMEQSKKYCGYKKYSYTKNEEGKQIEKYLSSRNKKVISLPEIPKISRHKWIRSKAAVSRFFKELDYNNQIQPSYDLTLLEMQNNFKKHDVA